ncbi:hypothetical protein P3T37_001370 [Kitasatospora sp. MAA4]|uniref:hypothetical protein n=1 Tax=Kitasatospora sp. MAA4 TaxID=3035093 RepID=UPI0024739542|nr:hypothetical protein [Kitasatospora sp. MAA4]MDH6131985.1 hypothetical protein [Kitasatospora sp. MAA4]
MTTPSDAQQPLRLSFSEPLAAPPEQPKGPRPLPVGRAVFQQEPIPEEEQPVAPTPRPRAADRLTFSAPEPQF